MQHQLIDLFAQRQVYKEYLAVCIGKPPEGEVSAPIGRHPVHRKEMAIVPQGKPAVSFFTPIAWNNKLSLVKVVITTGRTHQIRVHLKHLGMPVLGDQVYGQAYTNKKYAISRQLLHASVVRLEHPISREKLEFKAPLPADMIDIVGQIQAEKIS
jgi:23S rRNA pseudouridine1911/1915/1917 synthase